jgi:hypothetical protein
MYADALSYLGLSASAAASIIQHDPMVLLYAFTAFAAARVYLNTPAMFVEKVRNQNDLRKRFPFTFGLLRARDRTMTSNIHQIFKDDDGIRSLLVIVGKDHLLGMSDLLKETHGFTVVSF